MNWTYQPPWWLPGGDLQTIGSALWGRHRLTRVALQRHRFETPDGDFIDVDACPASQETDPDLQVAPPLLILFHGLEGSSASHYAQAFARECQKRGWHYAVPHFRGCSGEINRAPRTYHSGDHEEIGWILDRLRKKRVSNAPVWAVGVSLGGNALMRWAQESGKQARKVLDAAVAVCSPLDLQAAGRSIDRGWNRQIYARMFLRTMKQKARQKWAQYPGLFNLDGALQAKTIEAFDDVFTAPLHGFTGVQDYWSRASARQRLRTIKLPTLVLNARNDPFVPASSLPGWHEVSRAVHLWQPAAGGHVGFAQHRQGRLTLEGMPAAVCDWLLKYKGID